MRINNNYKTPLNFKGYTLKTNVKSNISPLKYCISESHLMRNLNSTIFAKNYITQNFSQGGNILVPGCSLCEGYTWATLFNKYNKNKQYKIIATDIVRKVIDDAKKGILPIGKFINNSNDFDESYLINSHFWENISKNQKEAKLAFKECFEKVPQNTKINSFTILQNDKNEKYKPKTDIFKEILTFNIENVFDIDKTNTNESAITISFRNAIYHILGVTDQAEFDSANLNNVEILFNKFHRILKPNGLFLLGSLPTEHLMYYPCKNLKTICSDYNFKETSVTKIHELLQKIGFKPIFYEDTDYNICLPTVWRKI